MNDNRTVLVLGASGGIGGEVARQLALAGWQVRGMKRALAAPTLDGDGIAWTGGDAMSPADVARAAQGCAVIVHAVNPPGYRDWGRLVLPMLDNTIAAAEANGALVVLPGTVYNYGPDAFPSIAEDAPQHPATRKGGLRVRMEAALQAYAERGGRALIVRAGDFFGPRAGNSWFAQGLVKPGKPVDRIANPAAPGVGHQWAYLPDVAATMVALIGRRHALDPFARFHMNGHWDPDGTAMCAAIARVVARRGGRATVGAFPWWLVRLATPFNDTLRELWEMRYLWRQPVRLDNARLVEVLGTEPHTPLDAAVERTLEGLGCLPPGTSAQRQVQSVFG
ncbi:NAD(P)H-binding protein [Telluria mixta]|uniref:NAD(P)H-binding protein n=1 Tax=Telluria mixta TaxID=34071 RepID=A0ABT2C7F7_9BURK|nr:NAD-dependent epimerase/dehydratase family protein [Telluria mixta]MCS0633276.1 NAD(P)H-binding protein [Telluria mixta]WEM94758.1 NAD(P)H-binding protein [Telluria mixta]